MPRPVRSIVAAGSAGGGKTTFINRLAKSMYGFDTITYSRPTKAANILGYPNASSIPEDKLVVYQHFGLIEQIHAERVQLDQPFEPHWLADRSVLDFVGYYIYRVPLEDRPFYINDDVYLKIAKAWLESRPYDLIVLIPPNSKGTEDRDTRLMYGVREVHDNIEELIKDWGLEDIVLRPKTDTPEERVQETLAWLREHDYAWDLFSPL